MSIIAIGTDLASIERVRALIEKHGDPFLARVFSERERAWCDGRGARATHYAGRFAAKEAVMKVLGTGWTQGVRWIDIELLREGDDAPRIELSGVSAEIARRLGIARIHVSLSHDAGMALAFCVGES